MNGFQNINLKKKKSSNRDKDKRITYALFVTPALILYSIFFIFPILIGVYYSFTDYNGISKDFKIVGLQNYVGILKDSRFIHALVFNLKYSIILIICVITLSLVIALLLNSKIKCRTLFRTLYFFPAVLSMLTVGLIFNEIFYKVVPIIGQFLNIGFLKTNILASTKTAIYGILATHIWQGVAIPTILFLAGLQTIPQELVEAASLDGANGWQKFKYITIPFILPVLSVILVLVLKDGISVFDYIVALTQGGPAGATESMSLLVYNYGFAEMKFSYGITGSIIMALIIIIISIIQIKFTNKKKVY